MFCEYFPPPFLKEDWSTWSAAKMSQAWFLEGIREDLLSSRNVLIRNCSNEWAATAAETPTRYLAHDHHNFTIIHQPFFVSLNSETMSQNMLIRTKQFFLFGNYPTWRLTHIKWLKPCCITKNTSPLKIQCFFSFLYVVLINTQRWKINHWKNGLKNALK